MRLHVPEMSCGHCTAAIGKAIAALDPGAKVETDLGTRTVDVVTSKADEAVIGAIRSAGYDSAPV